MITPLSSHSNSEIPYGTSLWDGSNGLVNFLGFLGNAEFSPWKSSKNSGIHKKKRKKFAGVFLTTSDDFLLLVCFEKNVRAIPVRVMKDQY